MFEGRRSSPVADLLGMSYLKILLEQPGKEVSVETLHKAIKGDETSRAAVESPIDPAALKAYNVRRHELMADIEQARRCGNQLQEEEAQKELDILIKEINNYSIFSHSHDYVRHSMNEPVHSFTVIFFFTYIIKSLIVSVRFIFEVWFNNF